MHIQLSPLDAVAIAIHEAAANHLPDIYYENRDWKLFRETGEKKTVEKKRRPEYHECFVEAMFPQTWPNTSCGHNGLAGQAMTSTYSVVVSCQEDRNIVSVFLGGKYAYTVKIDPVFEDDLKNNRLDDVDSAANHYEIVQ